jgi:hypothetical protein
MKARARMADFSRREVRLIGGGIDRARVREHLRNMPENAGRNDALGIRTSKLTLLI